MPTFPSDVLLPVNAKYYSFVDTTRAFNPDYDITWSFDFAVSAYNPNTQFAFSTFLLPVDSLLSSMPGHYAGVPGEIIYLLTESDEYLLTEDDQRIIYSTNLSGALVSIALDSTGLYALSSLALYDRIGVGPNNINPNSLIVRDGDQNVVLNTPISSFGTTFHGLCSSKVYQTIRFRYANSGRKLSIDYRPSTSSNFTLLTSIELYTTEFTQAYVGFAYTTPVSSTSTNIADMYIKNFHIDGNTEASTYETVTTSPLSAAYLSTYVTLSGVTVTAL